MVNKQNDEETAGGDEEVKEIGARDRNVEMRSSYVCRRPRAETP